MEQLTIVQQVAIWILPILFAVTLHEAAHGFVAHKLGDDTAYVLGRVTLNPIKHIDLLGTIIIPLVLMVTTGFVFGWAKPVPVNPNRLRHPKRDFALVALAGPTSNFLMAVVWMGLFKLSLLLGPGEMIAGLKLMSFAGVSINLVLMVLNLIPIPPLDGSRFINYLLPAPWDERFNKIAPFGIFIILFLIMSEILSYIMMPSVQFLQRMLLAVFNVH